MAVAPAIDWQPPLVAAHRSSDALTAGREPCSRTGLPQRRRRRRGRRRRRERVAPSPPSSPSRPARDLEPDKPARAERRRRRADAGPRVQPDVVVVAPSRSEERARIAAYRDVEAEGVDPEGLRVTESATCRWTCPRIVPAGIDASALSPPSSPSRPWRSREGSPSRSSRRQAAIARAACPGRARSRSPPGRRGRAPRKRDDRRRRSAASPNRPPGAAPVRGRRAPARGPRGGTAPSTPVGAAARPDRKRARRAATRRRPAS